MADQLPIPYIPRELEGEVVTQRQRDGYINATAMCQAAGKQFNDYARLGSTRPFVMELSAETGIPVTELVQSVRGGVPTAQGTWVHPQVAIHLAQWLSPRCAVRVTSWVTEWISTNHFTRAGSLPYHLRRYVTNARNVPNGHFSVLTEITMSLIAPLEMIGYVLPERLWPDISQGRMFSRWLRENQGVDTDVMPTYTHVFEDGRRSVQARAYPNEWLADFRRHFLEVWMPQKAVGYFRERDAVALEYLPRLLPAPEREDPVL